ncbi:MAG: glycosyltransferase family 2 protein [Anaerocolumna sp.]
MIKPLISVIVPIFNTQDYLARCIDSILEQSYTNIEILLVNDGSTDKSPDICDNYAVIDKRISVIHKVNGGISDARNQGLDRASGDYVTFLDSDDFLHPNFLKYLLYLSLKYNCETSVCSLYMGNGNNFIDKAIPKINIYTKVEAFLSRRMKSGVVGKLYRTALFDNVRFPVSDHFNYEDEALSYRLLYRCNRVCYTSRNLYYYFQSPCSTTRNTKHFKSIDFYDILEKRCEFFSTKEKELLEFSYEYACRCLMLFYMNCTKDKENTNDIEELLHIYKNYYFKMLHNKVTTKKYKVMFTMFYLNPKVITYFIHKFKIV